MSAGSRAISPHYTLADLTASQVATRHGWDNTPSPDVIAHLEVLATSVLEPLIKLGIRIQVTSCYRSPQLNKAIRGAAHSRHCEGLAVDLVAQDYSPEVLARLVYAARLPVDRIIVEFDRWVHLQLDPSGATRRVCYRVTRRPDGVTIYRAIDLSDPEP